MATNNTIILPLLLASILIFPAGCLMPPRASAQMRSVWLQLVPGERQDTLVLFLPGRANAPEDFQKLGLIDRMWEAGIAADAVLVDAHLGYYRERVFDRRLREDVVVPAREMGYARIWVVGVSLGGFGAVMYERANPGSWEGIVLLGPFTGNQKEVLRLVEGRSSLLEIELPPDATDDDYTANFWRWVQSYEQSPNLPILMGYGLDDRMREHQQVLAAVLGRDRVVSAPGGHTWPVWIRLWQELLPEIAARLDAGKPVR